LPRDGRVFRCEDAADEYINKRTPADVSSECVWVEILGADNALVVCNDNGNCDGPTVTRSKTFTCPVIPVMENKGEYDCGKNAAAYINDTISKDMSSYKCTARSNDGLYSPLNPLSPGRNLLTRSVTVFCTGVLKIK